MGGTGGRRAVRPASRRCTTCPARLAQADRRSRTRSGPVAPMAKGEADHPATASGRPGARGGQGMERERGWRGIERDRGVCYDKVVDRRERAPARLREVQPVFDPMEDMTMSRQSDEAKTSERARAHAAMLEEALKRPGIPELMRVYGDWRTADRGLDPYRAATKAPSHTTTTDHVNFRPGS